MAGARGSYIHIYWAIQKATEVSRALAIQQRLEAYLDLTVAPNRTPADAIDIGKDLALLKCALTIAMAMPQ